MLKISCQDIDNLDRTYPGLAHLVETFETRDIAACPQCHASDGARVEVGIVGVTMSLALATTRIRLMPNGPKPGQWFCNSCASYFD